MFYESLYGKNDLVGKLDKSFDGYDLKFFYLVCNILHRDEEFVGVDLEYDIEIVFLELGERSFDVVKPNCLRFCSAWIEERKLIHIFYFY